MPQKAPVHYYPHGYMPELNSSIERPHASNGGCGRLLVWTVAGAVVVGLLIWLGVSMLQRGTTEPATPTPSAFEALFTEVAATLTPDAWSATGTALAFATASPTVDYCWWMTPTPRPTRVPILTPDAWSATGTAVYLTENPPTTPTSTPDAPRAWCNVATATPQPSATAAPLLATATATNTPRLIVPSAPTAAPVGGGGQVVIPPTSAPIVVPTSAPIVLPTLVPSTATPSRTPTATQTATPTPTGAASLYLLVSYCDVPTFIVANLAGVPGALDWSIEIAAGRVAAGSWTVEMQTGNAGIAEARTFANVLEVYTLHVWAGGTLIYTATLDCRPQTPTLTPSPTPTATPTLNPEQTPEIVAPTSTLEPTHDATPSL